MVNVDYKLVIAGAVAVISLISIKGSHLKDPFKPFDDDQSSRPKRPIRRPKNPLRPRRPLDAEGKGNTKENSNQRELVAFYQDLDDVVYNTQFEGDNEDTLYYKLFEETYDVGGRGVLYIKEYLEDVKKLAPTLYNKVISKYNKNQILKALNNLDIKNNFCESCGGDIDLNEEYNYYSYFVTGSQSPNSLDRAAMRPNDALGDIQLVYYGYCCKYCEEDYLQVQSSVNELDWLVGEEVTYSIISEDDVEKLDKWQKSFAADPVDFEDDEWDDEKPTDWDIDKIHNELFVDKQCSMCDRPYDFSKLSRGLVKHYLRESQGGILDWKSKENPGGTRRTARNIAGYEIITYGLEAVEHYMLTQASDTEISAQVIMLLRKSLVPQIIIGDITEFIKLLEIDDVEETTPGFDEDFWTKWDLEDYMQSNKVFNTEHDDHDELDALIKKLDDLNQFAITFMHDGGYGGEPISKETNSQGLTTEIIGFIEDSIRLKIISHEENGEVIGIRISYTMSPEGPVIYLPPADYISYTPDGVGHDHDHDHHQEDDEEDDIFLNKLFED